MNWLKNRRKKSEPINIPRDQRLIVYINGDKIYDFPIVYKIVPHPTKKQGAPDHIEAKDNMLALGIVVKGRTNYIMGDEAIFHLDMPVTINFEAVGEFNERPLAGF